MHFKNVSEKEKSFNQSDGTNFKKSILCSRKCAQLTSKTISEQKSQSLGTELLFLRSNFFNNPYLHYVFISFSEPLLLLLLIFTFVRCDTEEATKSDRTKSAKGKYNSLVEWLVSLIHLLLFLVLPIFQVRLIQLHTYPCQTHSCTSWFSQ